MEEVLQKNVVMLNAIDFSCLRCQSEIDSANSEVVSLERLAEVRYSWSRQLKGDKKGNTKSSTSSR